MSSENSHSRQSSQTKPTAVATRIKTLMSASRLFVFVVQIVIFMLLLPVHVKALRQSHYVHWNTSNPIFRIDNTDHIIDVNRGNKPWEYDQVNIICPVYRPGTKSDEMETYIIYSVSKEEYDSCRITNPNPRVIALCNKPHELMYFTITFRSFTPTPGGMEFQPGKDYYFISTSAKGDIHRKAGGHCSSHHMKVAFKVANNQHESVTTTSKPRSVVNVPRLYGNDGDIQNFLDPASRDGAGEEEDYLQPYWSGKGYLGDSYARSESPLDVKPTKKRDDSFDSHQNEVVKHEASRMASNATIPKTCLALFLLLVFVVKLG